MKAVILGHLGFDAIVEQCFDKAFSSQSAEDFVTRTLCQRLGVHHVVTGYDFHFGKGREGNPDYLMHAGVKHGFGVTLVEQFTDENAEVVSSSRIREALAEGDVAGRGMLGYRYAVSAEIQHGQETRPHAGLSDSQHGAAARDRAQAGHLCGPLPPPEWHGP
jgi:riboflavin kinase/FMN adenylyltransferase